MTMGYLRCYTSWLLLSLFIVAFVYATDDLSHSSNNITSRSRRRLSDGNAKRCGTKSPSNPQERTKFSKFVKNWVDSHSNLPRSTIYITTYFWVLHDDDGTGLVTEDQIEQAMDYLNSDFGPYDIQFVQGATSPTFVDNAVWFASRDGSDDDTEMRTTLREGGAATLNIYTNLATDENGDEQYGYATYAEEFCHWQELDSVTVHYQTVPGEACGETGSTLAHEVGHWMNLAHTFENGCDDPGDWVDDTPPHEEADDWTCPLDRDTCPGDGLMDPVNNYMNYVEDACNTEFTSGQADVMLAAFDLYRLNSECDLPTMSPTTAPPGGVNSLPCFSAFSTMTVEGQGKTLMKDVVVGDKVLVSADDDDDGEDLYQEIYAFGHMDVYAKANFLQITTRSMMASKQEKTPPLEISGEHLIMKQSSNDGGEILPVRADSIRVGDLLIGGNGVAEYVTQISSVTRQGLYSPLTKNGKMVVNGLQVSSYTATQDQDSENLVVGNFDFISHHMISHAAIAPLRSICLLALGGSVTDYMLCNQRNQQGQLLFVAQGEKLVRWIMKQTVVKQTVLLTSSLPNIMLFHVLENILGSFIIIIVLSSVALVGLFLVHKNLACHTSVADRKYYKNRKPHKLSW